MIPVPPPIHATPRSRYMLFNSTFRRHRGDISYELRMPWEAVCEMAKTQTLDESSFLTCCEIAGIEPYEGHPLWLCVQTREGGRER
jgi:hypothetical protein